jgi:hypothetical protein
MAVLLSVTEASAASAPPLAVPTFSCMGLSWSPDAGVSADSCEVRYRKVGAASWNDGFPLWFDEREAEYRGSIVGLTAGTSYEIELRLASGADSSRVVATTWSEDFPIGQTVHLPAHSSTPLVVTESGTPAGYVLYTEAPGGSATIDVDEAYDHCVEIAGSYVIVRSLRLEGARQHAIRLLAGAHDVVIERNDITRWGEVATPEGWGVYGQSAVYSNEPSLTRVIIQRNRIHHPRADSNSWLEFYPNEGYHPLGPEAVFFFDTEGNHVIRYNDVYSDVNHYFTDIFGAGTNFSTRGFPNRDSDIYGNRLSHCWDDAIEVEGANENVRVWGNFIDRSFVHVASASTSIGPLYVFRNVSATSQRSDVVPWDLDTRGPFLKTSDQAPAGGRIYVLHNTLLQPPPLEGSSFPRGCAAGLGAGGGMSNVTSRNNILDVYLENRGSVNDFGADLEGDYDYDLYSGVIVAAPGNETNGIHAAPVYVGVPTFCLVAGEGVFHLAPSSPGRDDAIRLPNFNDGYTGSAPDIGAHEALTPPMQFGVNAYLEEAPPVIFISPARLTMETREAPDRAESAPRVPRPAVSPNPFRPAKGSRLRFAPIPAGARLAVHTVFGGLVCELVPDGAGGALWDGCDRSGRVVASGVYVVRISGVERHEKMKVIVRR